MTYWFSYLLLNGEFKYWLIKNTDGNYFNMITNLLT